MKKLLLLLLLWSGAAQAQNIEFYIHASELRTDTRRDVNGQAICFVGDTLKNGSVGGVFQFCDTCLSTTLWKDDSVTVFVYNAGAGYVWYRKKAYPTLKVITDGLGYTPLGWADTVTKVATKTNVAAASKYLASMSISGVINKILTAYLSNGDTIQSPPLKIPVTYSGTTNSSGIYAVTFATAYSVAPNIQANVVGGNNKWTMIPTVTTTGFSIYVQLRTDIVGLLPTYSNVNGAAIDVIITEK